MSVIIRAAQLAQRIHQGHNRRWDEEPYDRHLLRVAGRGCLIPDVSDWIVAAYWLHDTVEDHPGKITIEDIRNEFGNGVAGIVQELTNVKSKEPGVNRAMQKQLDRDRLRPVSYWAKIGKMLDRIDNLRCVIRVVRDVDAAWDFGKLYWKESILLAEALFEDTYVKYPAFMELQAELVQTANGLAAIYH